MRIRLQARRAAQVATAPSIHGPPDLELKYTRQVVGGAQDEIRPVFTATGGAVAAPARTSGKAAPWAARAATPGTDSRAAVYRRGGAPTGKSR